MQHEVQVGPGEFPKQSRDHDDDARFIWPMIVVVTVENVLCRMLCGVGLDVDENVFEEFEDLPRRKGLLAEGYG